MKIRDNVKPTLPPLPGGSYLGILVYSIGIGEQLCEFENKSKSYNNQVLLGFEICGQTIEIDGKAEPRVLSKTFNVSKSKKASLRKFFNAWSARELSDDEFLDLDTNEYVGKPAMLTVVLNDTGEYSNIDNIAPIPVGIPINIPQPLSTLIRFDMEPWNQAAFEALPEWAQERIKKSTEYQKEHIPVQDVAIQQPVGQVLQNFQQFMSQAPQQQPVATQLPQQFQTVVQPSVAGTQNTGGGVPF